MKKIYLFAVIALSASLTHAQKVEQPIYAKALERKISQLDLTSVDVKKRFISANNEEVKSLEGAKYIQLLKKNTKGLWDVTEFYNDGFLKMEGTFRDAKGLVRDGKFRFYRNDGSMDYEGIYSENIPDGEWRFYFPSGQLSAIESYENGTKVRQNYWNEDGSSLTDLKAAEKLLPTYTGGQYQLYEYLKNNIRITTSGKVSGKVVVSFWVDEQGSVQNPKIEESMGEIIDQEVLRAVKSMPKWTPAKQHNRPYKQMYILPVTLN